MDRLEKLLGQAHTLARTGYVLWDEFAVEVETAFLLLSLVRSLKPSLIVESGTGRGISATFLAVGLEQNGNGQLVTFETDEFFAAGARDLLAGLPATVRQGLSAGTDLNPEMVFVDGVSDRRVGEIEFWLTHPGQPLTVVHDARRSEYPFHLGEGVHVPGHDGVWIGRAKPQET